MFWVITINILTNFVLVTRSYKGIWCEEKQECSYLGTHLICVANECQCMPHYHINNEGLCIKDRGKELKRKRDKILVFR